MISDHYLRRAIVTNIVDGDTFDAHVDLGFSVSSKQRFRLLGCDAPEMTGTSQEAGENSKRYVEKLLKDKEICLRSVKTDSFGRYLADVWIMKNGVQINLSRHLIKNGYAKKYIK